MMADGEDKIVEGWLMYGLALNAGWDLICPKPWLTGR